MGIASLHAMYTAINEVEIIKEYLFNDMRRLIRIKTEYLIVCEQKNHFTVVYSKKQKKYSIFWHKWGGSVRYEYRYKDKSPQELFDKIENQFNGIREPIKIGNDKLISSMPNLYKNNIAK